MNKQINTSHGKNFIKGLKFGSYLRLLYKTDNHKKNRTPRKMREDRHMKLYKVITVSLQFSAQVIIQNCHVIQLYLKFTLDKESLKQMKMLVGDTVHLLTNWFPWLLSEEKNSSVILSNFQHKSKITLPYQNHVVLVCTTQIRHLAYSLLVQIPSAPTGMQGTHLIRLGGKNPRHFPIRAPDTLHNKAKSSGKHSWRDFSKNT